MKKIAICIVALILGVFATEAFGQVSVHVRGRSVVVQPPAYNVRVNVPQYYRVQPRPYLVTPHTIVPQKPQFWTPVRNFFWRTAHPVRTHYHVQPLPQPNMYHFQQMPHRPVPQ
jgi:hypothetical protein